MKRQVAVALFFLLLLAGRAGADALPDLNLYFSPGGQYVAGGLQVYLSPYFAQILTGDPSNPQLPIPIFCDDFSTDIQGGQRWTARQSEINYEDLADSRFGYNNPDRVRDYTHVAWLLNVLSDPGISPYLRAVYSFAAWEVFTPGARNGSPSLGLEPQYYSGHPEFWSDIDAVAADTTWINFNPEHWRVLTDVDTHVDGDHMTGGTQEFLYYAAPEPSGLWLLGMGLFAWGAFVRLRRRS